MNTRKRYLVLDRTNTPVTPASMGLNLASVQNPKSPSFLDPDQAKKFATLCAQTHIGQNYYVAEILGGVSANHDLDAALSSSKDGVAPTKWVDASASGTGEE